MAAQKHKKKFVRRKYFAFLNAYYPKKTPKPNSLDSPRPYGRLLENKKTGGCRELFLPENDFQNSSPICFAKNIHILEAWKPTEDKKFTLEFFCTCP